MKSTSQFSHAIRMKNTLSAQNYSTQHPMMDLSLSVYSANNQIECIKKLKDQ